MNSQALRALTIVLLLIAGVFIGVQLGKLSPLIGWYQDEMDFSLVLIGWLTALIAIFVALVALPAGWVIERIGLRTSFLAASLALIAGGVALAFSRAPIAVLGARLLEGVGYLVLVIATPALLTALSPLRWRAVSLAIWAGFVPVGFATSDFLARYLDAPAHPTTFLLAAILLFGAFALPGALLSGTLTDDREQRSHAAGTAAGLSATLVLPVVLVSLSFGLYAVVSVGFFAFLPVFLTGDGAFLLLPAGAISITVPLGNLGAALVMKGRSTRHALALGVIGFAAMAVSCWIAFASSDPQLATGAAILSSIAGGVVASALFAALPAVVPQAGSTALALGLICQLGGVGTMLGPPVAARTIEFSGWTGFGAWLAASSLCGAVLLLPLLRNKSIPAT